MTGDMDFADLLRGYAAQHERAAAAHAPDVAGEVLALAGRVRRRRLARTSAAVAVGAAAVLVGSVAVWGVTRPDPVVPAPQPTQSTVAPSPTEEPAPPTTDPTAPPEPTVPEGLTVHPLLPKVQPMKADLWSQTDDGWTLGRYRAARDEADGSRVESPTVLYLVAPDGTTYEVPVPESMRRYDGREATWTLRDWLPGQSRVVVTLYDPMKEVSDDAPTARLVVDLATGEELVAYDRFRDHVLLLPGGRTFVVRDREDGLRLAQVHDRDGVHLAEIGPFDGAPVVSGWAWSGGVGVDPSRTQLLVATSEGMSAFELPALRQLAIPAAPAPAQAPCGPYSWLEQGRLVVRCADGGVDAAGFLSSQLFVLNLGDGSSRRLTDAEGQDESEVTSVWQVGSQVVVGRAVNDGDCGRDLALVSPDGTQTPIGGVGGFMADGVQGDRLVGATWACVDADGGDYVRVDPRTGQVATIAPRVGGAEVSFGPASPRPAQLVDGGWTW